MEAYARAVINEMHYGHICSDEMLSKEASSEYERRMREYVQANPLMHLTKEEQRSVEEEMLADVVEELGSLKSSGDYASVAVVYYDKRFAGFAEKSAPACDVCGGVGSSETICVNLAAYRVANIHKLAHDVDASIQDRYDAICAVLEEKLSPVVFYKRNELTAHLRMLQERAVEKAAAATVASDTD